MMRPTTPRRPLRRSRLAIAVVFAALWTLPLAAEVRSPLDEASAIQQQLRGVAERAASSIFAVTAFAKTPADAQLFGAGLDGRTFAAIAERYERSCGTAFAIDAQGRLLTNEHVVAAAASVWVTDDRGRTFPAMVVGTDPRSDLAILSIPMLTDPLPLADEAAARGDMVLTLGNPDGQATGGSLCASVGSVSVAERSLPQLSERERRNYAHMIQTTVPIDVGSSGGPLLDLRGRVLGVMCAVATATQQPGRPSIGFATNLVLPQVRDRIARLSRGEEIIYGYLGVSVSTDAPAGARVDRIDADTPAAGVLREGDVVLRFAGLPVQSERTFIDLAGTCPPDQEIALTVRRGDAELDLTIRPRQRVLPSTPVTRQGQRLTWAGVTFANADGGGVRVAAIALDAAAPLPVGSTIAKVNGDAVRDLEDLLRTLHRHAGQPLELDAPAADVPSR